MIYIQIFARLNELPRKRIGWQNLRGDAPIHLNPEAVDTLPWNSAFQGRTILIAKRGNSGSKWQNQDVRAAGPGGERRQQSRKKLQTAHLLQRNRKNPLFAQTISQSQTQKSTPSPISILQFHRCWCRVRMHFSFSFIFFLCSFFQEILF